MVVAYRMHVVATPANKHTTVSKRYSWRGQFDSDVDLDEQLPCGAYFIDLQESTTNYGSTQYSEDSKMALRS